MDEVQNLDAWAPQVKHLVDNHRLHLLVTGSSSLRIEAGRDSLAGRITSIDLGPLLLREIAHLRFGYVSTPAWSENGTNSVSSPDFWLEAVELSRRESEPRQKAFAAFSELRATWLQEVVPLDPLILSSEPHLYDLAGHMAESTLGYFLASIPNLDLAHFPERGAEPEVDFILTVGPRRIPVEVKYRRRIDPHEDTRGLRAFLEKTVYNAPFGLLVTQNDDVMVPDPRIIPISLSSFLWLR